MPENVTKQHFDERLEKIEARFDGIEAAIRGGIQEVIAHFNQSQSLQNQRIEDGFVHIDGRFDDLNVKLSLVVEDFFSERPHKTRP